MITESEQRALQLAKKVFEHFTHDALPIAREILAMELKMGQPPLNGKPVNGITVPILEGKKKDVPTVSVPLKDVPGSNLNTTSPNADFDPAQPVRMLNQELVNTAQEDFPL